MIELFQTQQLFGYARGGNRSVNDMTILIDMIMFTNQ